MKTTRLIVLVALALLIAAPAWGHGNKVKTTPKEGESLSAAPSEVTVELSEEPSDEATVEVEDGCGELVSESLTIDGKTLVAEVGDAEPGKWKVSWHVISAVDGHATHDVFGFTVEGDKDCSRDGAKKGGAGDHSGDDSSGHDESSDEDAQANSPTRVDTSSEDGFPIVPVALGTVALIGIAAVVRRSATH